MSTLKKWLRKKLPSGKKDTPTPHISDPLPFLPLERPNILTSSPLREALVSSMHSYGYFQLLPYEIRRPILIEALGGRTLHMDLAYKTRGVRDIDGKWIINDDGASPQGTHPTWEWVCCVCHQPNLWPEGIPRRNFGEREIKNPRNLPCAGGCVEYMRNHSKSGPWIDGKKYPQTASLTLWDGFWHADKHSNNLGRYVEGIHVLFATNTIHMENYDLLQNLPHIFLPQRLHSIESLEISWTFRSSVGIFNHKPLEAHWKDPTAKDSELHELCRMVPKLCPHLRRLNIHLLCNIGEPYPLHREGSGGVERVILGPVEDMIRVLGPGPEICIAILYFKYLALPMKVKVELYNPYTTRLWKELDAINRLGYWICRGYPDHCRLGMDVFENYQAVNK